MQELRTYEEKKRHDSIKHRIYHNRASLPIEQSIVIRLYFIIRWLSQIMIALLALPLLVLLVPIIWLANYITDQGDLFYHQERIGQHGQRFSMIKFRTMVMDAEKQTGAVWASEEDPRITPVGRFLRQTHLDELPQLWNVFKGEMSIIGPRPERPHFVQQLTKEISFYSARHAVKPGLTGWAQVKYRYGASVEDTWIKLEYDLYYIKHQGPYLDLLILLKTVQVVLGRGGR